MERKDEHMNIPDKWGTSSTTQSTRTPGTELPVEVSRLIGEVESSWQHAGVMGGYHKPSKQRAERYSNELCEAIAAALHAASDSTVDQNFIEKVLDAYHAETAVDDFCGEMSVIVDWYERDGGTE
jgi:hypothetical protein